jgi:integrase
MGLTMGRRVKEVALGTRTARSKLAPRHKPYFRLVTEGIHVGYRRSTVPNRAGTWLARRYLFGAYETELLGTADDLPDMSAEGVKVLTFAQAETAARDWARGKAAAARAATTKIELVRTAVETYIAQRIARDSRAGRNAQLRLNHHVLNAPIAAMPLLALTDQDLKVWRGGLKRGGRAKERSEAPLTLATLARLLNDFRAALTEGASNTKAPADLLTTIRNGLKAPKAATRIREKQVLPEADVRRIVVAATALDDDFGDLVAMLSSTGSRFDQVARVTVADFQPDARRVMVPVANKGNGARQITHTAVPLAQDVVERIRPLTAGRAGHEPLLMRWHHRQVPGDISRNIASTWEQAERRQWKHSGEMARLWDSALQAAGMPETVVPYALRHSSIVRMLRSGLPVTLVAKVHDTSAAMIQKHYGAFIVDASEDLLRAAAVSLGSANVVQLHTKTA